MKIDHQRIKKKKKKKNKKQLFFYFRANVKRFTDRKG